MFHTLFSSRGIFAAHRARFAVILVCLVAVSTGTFAFADGSHTGADVKFVGDTYMTAGYMTQNLDGSGRTIPTTKYSIPAGAIFMATNGNDANNGLSVDTPVKTLNRAISLVPNSGTIVVRGGDYRDWYSPSGTAIGVVNKGLTLQAYPGESPWFTGSDVVNDGWTASGSVYSRAWSTPTFCNGQYYSGTVAPYTPQRRPDGTTDTSIKQTTCMYEDAANDPAYPMAGDPQQIFVNGNRLREVRTLGEVTTGTFYYDWAARRIHMGENPSGKTVELSARPGAMVLAGAETDSHIVRGIGFRRYATNGSEGTQTAGAITFARKALLENVVISENSSGGFGISNPRPGTIVRSSVIAYNGSTGMTGNGVSRSAASGARNDLLVEGNIFNGNNWERGGKNCNRACGPANIKIAHMVGYTFRHNIIENTFGNAPGVWCDLDCSDAKYVNNIVRNNGGSGIFHEVSNTGIIAGNLVVNNDQAGILVTAGNTKIYNNTVATKYGSSVESIRIYDDRRTPPSATAVWPWGSPDVGPNTANIELANNLIVGPMDKTGARLIMTAKSAAVDFNGNGVLNTTPDKYYSYFDYNAFYTLSNQNLYAYIDGSGNLKDAIKSSADLRSSHPSAANFEKNSFANVITAAAGSPFENAASGDYRLKTDSQAATSKGRALPADVAAAMGLSAGAVIARGAPTRASSGGGGENVVTTVAPTTVATTTTKPTTTTTVAPTTTTRPPTTTTTTTTTRPPTTTTTTTTTRPATTTTTVPPTTTTTRPATTTTTTTTRPPVTTTTTRPPNTTTTTTRPPTTVPPGNPIPSDRPELIAMSKILVDHDLDRVKQTSWTNPVLKGRAYYKSAGFLYLAADFTAQVDANGNYTVTEVSFILSFAPIQ